DDADARLRRLTIALDGDPPDHMRGDIAAGDVVPFTAEPVSTVNRASDHARRGAAGTAKLAIGAINVDLRFLRKERREHDRVASGQRKNPAGGGAATRNLHHHAREGRHIVFVATEALGLENP